MIIDNLDNCKRYLSLHPKFEKAFAFLMETNLDAIAPGKYNIDENDVFAIVQEYDTLDALGEQMESHEKYIDVQYMIRGGERVGLALLSDQSVSKLYNDETDFMLYADAPSFFAELSSGIFMIFFPTDLHMPCIKIEKPAAVRKIVIKVKALSFPAQQICQNG
ncbi:MAG TPA: YhcH/YjgK/YiaL family protein [Panacibacter sp.]|nr:YhcH/YjgK/YiaL family protein [Panacibacter sp.]HNP45843.1 YhcH/YjgK/YiaL family protein [Panacibacter sp.]